MSPLEGRVERLQRMRALCLVLVLTLGITALVTLVGGRAEGDTDVVAAAVADGAASIEQRPSQTSLGNAPVTTTAPTSSSTSSTTIAPTTTAAVRAAESTTTTRPPTTTTAPRPTATTAPPTTSVPTTSPPTTAAPTTTAPPQTTTTTTAPPAAEDADDSSDGETRTDGDYEYGDPRGTQVWLDLAQCESHQRWDINSGNGYYGGLQFSLNSWQGVGGEGYPHEHPRNTQIEMGRRLQARQGWGAWPHCSREIGVR